MTEMPPKAGARSPLSDNSMSPTPANTTVPAAARTMALFETFARERREMTKSELARLLDLPESSCSDLLNTLYVLGYVSRTPNSKRYYPTGRLMTAAQAISESDPLGSFGAEACALLSQRSGETSTFGVIEGDGVKIIAVAEGSHRLRYVVNAGDKVSLHATSLGKSLLGAIGDVEMGRVLRLKPLRAFSDATKTDPKDVETEVRQHRDLGWYSASEEGGVGICSLAVSATMGSGAVAISMIGPADRMRGSHERYLAILKEVEQAVFYGEDSQTPKRGRPPTRAKASA